MSKHQGGISRTILKSGFLELAVDAEFDQLDQEVKFTISMGTGFTGRQPSVNIEMPPMTESDFRVVLRQFYDALEDILNRFKRNRSKE